MQRLLAIMVGFAFVGFAAQVSALHIHAYADHEHAEHRHGPAAHEHPQAPLHPDEADDAAHLESCDPGQHAVSVTLSCPPLPRIDGLDAPFSRRGSLEPLMLRRSATTLTDVRVHGPPALAQASPRAPPPLFPA